VGGAKPLSARAATTSNCYVDYEHLLLVVASPSRLARTLPYAVAEVRGTEFFIRVDDDGAL
jgi:hypothetical protein